MKKFFYYFVAMFFITDNIQASSVNSCKLSKNEYILIGCTKKCAKTYKQAILKTAKELNYNVRFKNFNYYNTNYNAILSQVDGIISPGGHDIEPKYYTKLLTKEDKKKVKIEFKKYGKTNHKGKIRDKFEYGLFKEYIANDKYKNLPVLGICYGMQMLSAVEEIPLYVDIPTDIGIPARRKINDTVFFREKSNLNKYFKNNKITGYKNHHQAINLKYFDSLRKKGYFKNVAITGISNQGKIAEVLELKNRPAIGLQFHPERSSQITKRAIFSYFLINACNSKVNSKITHDKLQSNQEVYASNHSVLKTDNNTLYYIQVGSFKAKPNQRLIKIIKENKFQYIINNSSSGMKKLLIGSFNTKRSVKDALIIVKNMINKQAFILKGN